MCGQCFTIYLRLFVDKHQNITSIIFHDSWSISSRTFAMNEEYSHLTSQCKFVMVFDRSQKVYLHRNFNQISKMCHFSYLGKKNTYLSQKSAAFMGGRKLKGLKFIPILLSFIELVFLIPVILIWDFHLQFFILTLKCGTTR